MNQQPAKSNVLSGFRDIDEIMGGYPRGELTVIASRSSHGKSAYALSVVANMAKMGLSIMFFATEMTTQRVASRLIAGETGINTIKIDSREFTPEEATRYQKAVEAIKHWNIVFDDTAHLTTESMRATTYRMHQTHHFDAIVVDTLQMMESSKGTDDESYLSHISQECKALAAELNVALLGVSQLKRPDGKDQAVRPVLADLPKSLTQNASMVQFVYRDELENPITLYPDLAEIITAKSDNGLTGTTWLYFKKSITRFIQPNVYHVDLSDLE
jgi:replicative DNA helicase